MCALNSLHQGSETTSKAMLHLIYGFLVSRVIYVAAKLGLPDLLQDQAKGSSELAEATGMHAPSLNRVLRTLVSFEVLTEDEQGRFALAPLGATLRRDVPGSLHALALLHLDEDHFRAWGDILHSVQTGEPAFNHQFGMGVWEYRALHPEMADNFDKAMANFVGLVNQAILAAYDFSTIRKMVDVGGGNGSLLAALLNANSEMTGIVFDVPQSTEGAKKHIASMGLTGRCEVAAGDFFASVPEGGDAYILSRVIHDWDDTQSIAILQTCHRAIPPQGKLLLIERVIQTRTEPSTAVPNPFLSDLTMLVITGGRERTEVEFKALFEAAHFRLTRVIPTKSEFSVIEAVPV